MTDVAAALRAGRLARRLTQEQVGRLLNPPLDHSLISRYEHGLTVPAVTLAQLARLLHLELTARPIEPTALVEQVSA
jgi:transcriptional regulator with XRE-family HTH domain